MPKVYINFRLIRIYCIKSEKMTKKQDLKKKMKLDPKRVVKNLSLTLYIICSISLLIILILFFQFTDFKGILIYLFIYWLVVFIFAYFYRRYKKWALYGLISMVSINLIGSIIINKAGFIFPQIIVLFFLIVSSKAFKKTGVK